MWMDFKIGQPKTIVIRMFLFGIAALVFILAAAYPNVEPVNLDPKFVTQNEAVSTLYTEGIYAEGVELERYDEAKEELVTALALYVERFEAGHFAFDLQRTLLDSTEK